MTSMKRRSGMRWDGETKNKTKNCNDCNFKINFYDKEICSWGVAFKYIMGETNLRKCEYFGREPPKNNSYEYVITAKQNNLFGKSKNYRNEKYNQLKINFQVN